jgi:hypothetical protein
MHLNFVEPIPKADDKHLNLFGINVIDENAERERLYQEALGKYPFDVKSGTCEQLAVLIQNVSLDINAMNERIARGDTNRVGKRYVDGYTRRKTELQQFENTLQCSVQKQNAEKQEFFDTQNQQLANVQKLSEKTSGASTYILIGMMVLIVTVSGIIIVKKLKK